MKASHLVWRLLLPLLLWGIAVQLPAQQNDADHKLFVGIKTKAEKGDAQSQFQLGEAFYFGKLGVAKDNVEAVKWFRKAAEQNYGPAQYNLGACYNPGEGVAEDDVEAVKWFRKAAEQNYAMAQFNLGACYDKGVGVAEDDVKAVKWYRKAAEQNHAKAQVSLGFCYAHSQGVAKDEVESVKWYRKAAGGGEASVFNSLAWHLATSANSAIRDGSNAVVFAEKAVAATNRKSPADLDTLAAAYAEAGQFEKAGSTEREAIALQETEATKNDYRTRLNLYDAKVPYRAKD
jgi:tetratricopeptide (TPR) repeat protein